MQSLRTKKYAAFHAYLGIKNAETLTDQELERIEDYGAISWAREKSGLSDTEFEKRDSAWWEGERFILHPVLYAGDIKRFLKDELPEQMATYVRGQFTGSSGRITKAKVIDAVASLNENNPEWWHSKQRKQVFLRRFSEMFPDCIDGRPKERKESPSADAPLPRLPPQQKQRPQKQKRVIKINLLYVILIVIVALILWKWLF